MSGRTFMLLLVGALVIGSGLGGIVIAATSLGGGDSPVPAQASLTAPSNSSVGQQSSDQASQGQSDGVIQSSDSQVTPGGGGQLIDGGVTLTGTVEKIEPNALTINTGDGSLLARVGDETTIQSFAEVSSADLETGMRVMVIGERREDGLTEATSILVTPEGEEGFLGVGGLLRGRGPGAGGQQIPGQPTQEQLAQIRQQLQSQGGLEEGGGQQLPDQIRQRLQGLLEQGTEGQDFGGGGVLTGTIEAIEDGIATIDTPRGPLQVSLSDDTTIQMLSQGTLSDLPLGSQVRLVGQQEDDGTFEASGVFMVPDGEFGPLGPGLFGGQGGAGRPGFQGGPLSPGAGAVSP